MPRKSYAAHRAARTQQVPGSYAESETDAESLASYSTLISSTSYATHDSSLSYSHPHPRYAAAPSYTCAGEGGLEAGSSGGYGRPQLRPRTFSGSSAGSFSPSMGGGAGYGRSLNPQDRSPGQAHSRQQLPPLMYPRPRHLLPHGKGHGNGDGISSGQGSRSSSFSRAPAAESIAEDEPSERIAQTPAMPSIHVSSASPSRRRPSFSTQTASQEAERRDSAVDTRTQSREQRHADRVKRREARETRRVLRRAERESKSTLGGDRYDTVLRRILRWAGRRGWGWYGMMLIGMWPVVLHRVLVLVWVYLYPDPAVRDLHAEHPIYQTMRSLAERSKVQGPTWVPQALLDIWPSIGPMATQLGLEMVLIWPAVHDFMEQEARRTGRTLRSQITAIATVLLSPGITCILHNTDRLGALDVAAMSACLGLLSRGNGRTLETLILSGLVMTFLGPVGVWVAVPALVMWVGCTVVPGKTPAGPLGPYTWRLASLTIGLAILAASCAGWHWLFSRDLVPGPDLATAWPLCDFRAKLRAFAALACGNGIIRSAQVTAAFAVAIAGSAVPLVIVAQTRAGVEDRAKREKRRDVAKRDRMAGDNDVVAHNVDGSSDMAAKPTTLPDIVEPRATATAPEAFSIAATETIYLVPPPAPVSPLLPLVILTTAIPLSIAAEILRRVLGKESPGLLESWVTLMPAVPLALYGAFRGRSAPSDMERRQHRHPASADTAGVDDGQGQGYTSEEDQAWEMNSLVQLVLFVSTSSVSSSPQVVSGALAAVMSVVVLGWHPWKVKTQGWYAGGTLRVIQIYLAIAALSALRLYLVAWAETGRYTWLLGWLLSGSTLSSPSIASSTSAGRIQASLPADEDLQTSSSLQLLRANLPLTVILAYVLVWPWAIGRLIRRSWTVGGLL